MNNVKATQLVAAIDRLTKELSKHRCGHTQTQIDLKVDNVIPAPEFIDGYQPIDRTRLEQP